MRWYIPNQQQHMYRMAETPPEMELNDYIAEYKRTGDDYWFACYLHIFEQTKLNGWVFKLCRNYNQESRFDDVKQEMVQALFEKLDAYDPTVGTTLLQFAKLDMVNAVHNYFRRNVGIFLLSDRFYKHLRRVNFLFYRNEDCNHYPTLEERLQTVIAKTGLVRKSVLNYLDHGRHFRYPENIDDSIIDFLRIKRVPDDFSSPENIVLYDMFMDVYYEQIENLRLRDRALFLEYLGILCLNCGWVMDRKKLRLSDIADKHQLRDEQSITNRYDKILENIRKELVWQGWIMDEYRPRASEPVMNGIRAPISPLDREIINYAVRKWEESGNVPDMMMLFREEKREEGRRMVEYMKLWLN